MFDRVHLNKKGFGPVFERQRVYIKPGKAPLKCPCVTSKPHIPEVMFLTANTRPRVLEDGTWWNGKISIWQLTEQVAGRRSSCNGALGTIKTKTVNMTGEHYEKMLTEKVLPALVSHPFLLKQDIVFLQDDNGGSHTASTEKAMGDWATARGFSICVLKQPAQSPDLNTLDLGFFRSLQTRSGCLQSDNIEELVQNVVKRYEEYDTETHNKVCKSLFAQYKAVLNHLGDNNIK
ncbi:unnamed protein product, partial [Choristocarpus tenellus]